MQLTELAKFLETLADEGNPTTYDALVNRFGLPPLTGTWNSHPLAAAFDRLDQEDAEAKRPFRTSMVISKTTNMPGNGYFTSLEKYKGVRARSENSRLQVFMAELKKATAYKNW